MQEINTAVPIDEKNKVKFTINHLFYIADPHTQTAGNFCLGHWNLFNKGLWKNLLYALEIQYSLTLSYILLFCGM